LILIKSILLNFWILGGNYLLAMCLFSGCTLSSVNSGKNSSEAIFDSKSRQDYLNYIKENMNTIYFQSYRHCEYLVEADSGIKYIQNFSFTK
jgi:hypothetical protein